MELIIFLNKHLPLKYLIDFENRLCFVYIISSMFLGLIYYRYYAKKDNSKSFWNYFFNHKILLHKSCKSDMCYFLINFWIKLFLLTPFLYSSFEIASFSQIALTKLIPNHNAIIIKPFLFCLIYTLMYFILTDLSRYLMHYFLHKIPFLWHLHKTHHSATIMTPITFYRLHPFEAILFFIRHSFISGLITGGFLFFFYGTDSMLTIMSVQIFAFLFNLFGSNLRHSHIPISFGSILEMVFISPRMHQFHHSINKDRSPKNLGSTLAIWDKIFGTYKKPDCKPMRFGLYKE
jgi:sterol desaturase/sphingolipid hydroxylase (fatty acid hydroxylase superfamily)